MSLCLSEDEKSSLRKCALRKQILNDDEVSESKRTFNEVLVPKTLLRKLITKVSPLLPLHITWLTSCLIIDVLPQAFEQELHRDAVPNRGYMFNLVTNLDSNTVDTLIVKKSHVNENTVGVPEKILTDSLLFDCFCLHAGPKGHEEKTQKRLILSFASSPKEHSAGRSFTIYPKQLIELLV